MINCLLTSFFIHAAILLSLFSSPAKGKVNTSEGSKVQVEFRQNLKSAPVSATPGKLLNSLESKNHDKNAGKKAKLGGAKLTQADMTEYANQVKALVDPEWVQEIQVYLQNHNVLFTTEVLILFDTYGKITSVKIVKSSGSYTIDHIALNTLKTVNTFPKPPIGLNNIIWSFSNEK